MLVRKDGRKKGQHRSEGTEEAGSPRLLCLALLQEPFLVFPSRPGSRPSHWSPTFPFQEGRSAKRVTSGRGLGADEPVCAGGWVSRSRHTSPGQYLCREPFSGLCFCCDSDNSSFSGLPGSRAG